MLVIPVLPAYVLSSRVMLSQFGLNDVESVELVSRLSVRSPSVAFAQLCFGAWHSCGFGNGGILFQLAMTTLLVVFSPPSPAFTG